MENEGNKSSPPMAGITDDSAADMDHEMCWTTPPLSSSTPLHRKMGEFERSLRCDICGNFYRNPVSLIPCHHTFCSECIRSHFKSRNSSTTRAADCPCCRETINTRLPDNRYLIPNQTIEKLCGQYESLRGDLRKNLCQVAAQQTANSPPTSPSNEPTHASRRRSPRSVNQTDKNVPDEGNIEEPAMTDSSNGLKRRTKIIYKLCNKKQLVEFCKKDGLSTKGSEEELKVRHEEFMNLYFAECDSTNPRPASELAAEINRRESARRTESMKNRQMGAQMKRLKNSRKQAGDGAPVSISSGDSQFDNKMKSNFSAMIREVRNRTGESAPKPDTEKRHDKVVAATTNNMTNTETEPAEIPNPSETAMSNSSPVVLPQVPAGAPTARRNTETSPRPSLPPIPSQRSVAPLSSLSNGNTVVSMLGAPNGLSHKRNNKTIFTGRISGSNKRPKRQKNTEWVCKACTFINKVHRHLPARCEMCNGIGNHNDAPETIDI